MANLVKRLVKGSPLTHAELDGNFENLNQELATKAVAADIDAALNTVGTNLAATIAGLAPSANIDTTNADNITSGTLAVARLPDLDWSKIVFGKPTTLAGYGITDAMKVGVTIDGGTF